MKNNVTNNVVTIITLTMTKVVVMYSNFGSHLKITLAMIIIFVIGMGDQHLNLEIYFNLPFISRNQRLIHFSCNLIRCIPEPFLAFSTNDGLRINYISNLMISN